MDNFDLKQYLGDNRLVKEEQLNEGLLDWFKKVKKVQTKTSSPTPKPIDTTIINQNPGLDPKKFIGNELERQEEKLRQLETSAFSIRGQLIYLDRSGISENDPPNMMPNMYRHYMKELRPVEAMISSLKKSIPILKRNLANPDKAMDDIASAYGINE